VAVAHNTHLHHSAHSEIDDSLNSHSKLAMSEPEIPAFNKDNVAKRCYFKAQKI
jgi:hypothetical protein